MCLSEGVSKAWNYVFDFGPCQIQFKGTVLCKITGQTVETRYLKNINDIQATNKHYYHTKSSKLLFSAPRIDYSKFTNIMGCVVYEHSLGIN